MDYLIFNDYASYLAKGSTYAKEFHINTKHSKRMILSNMYRSRKLINNPNFRKDISLPEKSYPFAKKISLPTIENNDELVSLLKNRRSQIKSSKKKVLTLKEISYLCWSMYGMNVKNTRTAPSAGALYPCEIYLLSLNTDLGKGIYHYRPKSNSLERIKDSLPEMDSYLMTTKGFENTSLIVITTGIIDRVTFKYDIRGYRYMLLEAGAIAQNLSLMATKFNLIATWFGGSSDVDIEKLLDIDGINESLINCVLINYDEEK